MDGLLIDSERLALAAFNNTCELFKLGDMSQLFTHLIGINSTLAQSILRRELPVEINYQQFDQLWQQNYLQAINRAPLALMPGVHKLLKRLQLQGMPMAVATSSKTQQAKQKLKGSAIHDYFSFIVGGDQVVQSKPQPDIYLKVAAQLAVSPVHCLAFEDSKNGVKAAFAAGMTVVQIPDLVAPDDELLALGHIILTQIDQVLEYNFCS
ncbi:MAG: hypothetical protein OFPI_07550 [Osedax symbiont Rs2]|nr:MAG: hypothetical protein OFPI_07550 [Osedax symbiont Rs2]